MDGVVPRLGADVPQWYGETTGFWDGEALITWTSNIQGWKVHGGMEFSNKLQTIYNVDGVATPVAPGTVIEHEVPDIYGRPWAENWRKHHEQGMEGAPESEDNFRFE